MGHALTSAGRALHGDSSGGDSGEALLHQPDRFGQERGASTRVSPRIPHLLLPSVSRPS
jgi:hypothetical protein